MDKTFSIIDAFTNEPFRGNPAAVLLLTEARPEHWMQSLARELGFSETAFVVSLEASNQFNIRWFTPTTEVDLCGHATLASAHAIWENGIIPHSTPIQFSSRSGYLYAKKSNDWIELDFPASTPLPLTNFSPILEKEFGDKIKHAAETRRGFLLELKSQDNVVHYIPDFARLSELDAALAITAQSRDSPFDFVSRVFVPHEGIPEDPVTGSAHCYLAPYWSKILGKDTLVGYQASKRGGVVRAELRGTRCHLFGQAITIIKGAAVI